nr:hypothetical protein [Tanacetum cinerariifolium]
MVAGKVNNVVVEKDQFLEELYSLGVRPVPAKMAEFLKEIHMKDRETMEKLQVFEREIKLNARKKDIEVVARDSGKLGVLEQLLVGTHTGISLKDGYVADMDEKE